MPPFKVCGTVVSSGAEVPAVFDAAAKSVRVSVSAGAMAYVRLSAGCDAGASIDAAPTQWLRVVRRFPAAHGGLVMIEVQVVHTPVTMRVVGGGDITARAVRFAG